MDIFISERYIIHDALGSGGMGAVYRATDRLTNETVALKRVLTTPTTGSTPSPLSMFDTPSSAVIEDFDLRIALAREFQTLATLRHPNIIDVLDYGFDVERLPFFTMRLLDDAQNILEAAQSVSHLERVDFAMQMVRALSYLHRRDILHRDIKPNNVLVAGNHVIVVDFGLAQTTDMLAGPVGSVPYVAPEIFRGGSATEASDIYAAGIILYQLFVGAHPFDLGDRRKLVDNVLQSQPNLDPLLAMSETLTANGIEPKAMRYVIGQMLEKDPDKRLADAEAVIYALSQCTNHRLSVETIEIRESIIRSPGFVGRDHELALLHAALKDTTENGRGGAWLIGGESGAGKSRLLEEVRIRALVEGAVVVRGQAQPDGTLQHAWGDIPRRLALASNLAAAEAVQLRDIVPDIIELRDIPPTMTITPPRRSDIDHIVSLWLALFKSQTRPIVIIMEDLHWAPLENLRVLQRLHHAFAHLPILWIGSYRDDEHPALPKRLPNATTLKLKRFEIEEMLALSVSILGPVGRDTRLLALLERETGGNPFLIVEIIRALANQAGTLRGVHEIEIPDTLRTSTAQALIKRRLDHIPHIHRPLLAMAALAGREIDLSVLRVIVPDTDLNMWLTDNLNGAVLVKIDNGWYFAHDQLRQGILEHYITDSHTRRTMHLQIANAIEIVYGDIRNKSPQLAYHFGEGHDYLKERHYSAVAGEFLMQENAPRSALPYLERTTELCSNLHLPPWPLLRRAHLFRLLGDAYSMTGNTTKSRNTLLIAAELLGEPMPSQPAILHERLQHELFEQYRRQTRPSTTAASVGVDAPRLMETVMVLDRLAEVAMLLSEQELAQYAGLRGVNLAERIGVSDLLARLYATAARIYHLQGDFSSGRAYSRLAVFIGTAINNAHVLGWAWLQRGNIAMLHSDWDDIKLAIEEATPIFRQTNDDRRLEELWSLQAFLELEHHADLDAALKTRQQVTISAKQRGDDQFLIWGLNGQAEINLHRFDQLQTAIRQTNQASQLAREIQQPESIRALGLNALAHYFLGDFELAAHQATHTAEALLQLGDTVVWRISGIDGALQVLYMLHNMGFGDNPQRLLETAAHLQYRLSQMVMRVPLAEVYAQRWLGTRAWIEGDDVRAETHWQISLERARARQMPFQYARTLVEYGRHLRGSARQQTFDDALSLFISCDATTDILYIRQLG